MPPSSTTPHTRLLLSISTGLLAGLVFPLLSKGQPWWPGLLIGVGLAGLDWRWPQVAAPLWRTLERAGRHVGHYTGIGLTALLYMLVITPCALIMRLRSATAARQAAAPDSYYLPPDKRDPKNMNRAF